MRRDAAVRKPADREVLARLNDRGIGAVLCVGAVMRGDIGERADDLGCGEQLVGAVADRADDEGLAKILVRDPVVDILKRERLALDIFDLVDPVVQIAASTVDQHDDLISDCGIVAVRRPNEQLVVALVLLKGFEMEFTLLGACFEIMIRHRLPRLFLGRRHMRQQAQQQHCRKHHANAFFHVFSPSIPKLCTHSVFIIYETCAKDKA